MTPPKPVLDAAHRYVELGRKPVPIPPRQKKPVLDGWQKLRLTADDLSRYFDTNNNIGILNGEPSAGVVDVDLDAPEAVAVAAIFLPSTGLIFGRDGKPRSHWEYIADPLAATKQFKDCDGQKGGDQTMLVEFRSTGTQTVWPPSTHPSGEMIRFDAEGEPARMDGAALQAAVARVAACALLARHWPKQGSRHDAALATAGVLLRGGWETEKAAEFVGVAAKVAGDEEWKERENDVRSTAKRLGEDGAATGGPTLAQIVGEKLVAKLCGWLDLRRAGTSRPDGLERARGIVTALPERAKSDKFTPFEPETLGALALVKDANPAEWMRTREELKKQGISLGELDRAVKDQKKKQQRGSHLHLVKQGETASLRTAGQMLPDAPLPELRVPESYLVQEDATVRVMRGKNPGDVPQQYAIAYAPILITGVLRDVEDGTEALRLAYRRQGQWHDRTVDRGRAFDSRRLVELASHGVPVASDNSKEIVSYLRALEAVNDALLPCSTVSSHLGWQGRNGDAGFMWGHEHLAPPDWTAQLSFRGLDGGDEQIADAYHGRGTVEDWIGTVKRLVPYPKALIALYTAFVPPLQSRLGIPNFALDLHNRTSTGKTTCARIAASAWGNPDEREPNSAVQSWDATRVYVERASAVLSGIPLILDDTKRVKHPRMVADLLYTLANGRGRGRGNRTSLARTPTWRTVLISTGEAPATSFTQDGGIRMRCLELPGVPFGKDDKPTAKLVDELNLQIQRHYGHAGPQVVRYLNEHPERWQKLEERYRAGVEYYAAQNPRLASYMAAIHVAAELAHEVLGLPWCPCQALWTGWTAMAMGGEDAAPEIRALRDIVSWANEHKESFFGRHQIVYVSTDQQPQPRVPFGGWSGKWEVEADKRDLNAKETWKSIGFYPTVLDRVLREMKYEPAAIRAAWKERAWLECEKDRDTTKKYIEGEHPRLVVIRRAAIEEADA